MNDTIRIGVVEDQDLFRQGIRLIVETWEDMEVMFESEDGYSVIDKLNRVSELPHVLLVDLSLPPDGDRTYSGLDLTRDLRVYFPEINVLILSVNDDPYFISQLIENGASGYLTKDSDPDEVCSAIKLMYEKGSYINSEVLEVIQNKMKGAIHKPQLHMELTKREIEVLKLVCQQLTAEEIGERLFISTKTVNGHRNNLLQKTNSKNVTGLVMYAIKHQLVDIM